MAIYDNNGSTNAEIGKLYDNNGTTSTQIGKVYDNNGTTNSLIYQSETKYVNTPVYKSGVYLIGSSITNDKNWDILGWYDVSNSSVITVQNTKTTSQGATCTCNFFTAMSTDNLLKYIKYDCASTAVQTINVPSGSKYMLVSKTNGGTFTVTIY